MLPSDVVSRLFDVGDVFQLQFLEAAYSFKVTAVEEPINLYDFSLGTASGMATAGTGWNNIQDGSNNYLLQPVQQGYINQVFVGISPSYARVYRSFPTNTPRGALITPPTIGGQFGYVTGRDSPYYSPSPLSEFFATYNLSPAFLGYNPRILPASLTVLLNFFLVRYAVAIVGSGVPPKRTITMGGVPAATTPQWILQMSGA